MMRELYTTVVDGEEVAVVWNGTVRKDDSHLFRKPEYVGKPKKAPLCAEAVRRSKES